MKNVIFWRKCGKYDFLYLSRQWPEWRYMVGNRSLTCSKAILHRNLISNHVLKHFGKIEKNRFWKFFSDHASTKLAENQFFGRISAKFYFEAKEHIYAPFRKISWSLSRIFSNFSTKCMKTTHFAKKATFHKSVVFVAFVAFLGTTMLFFKKYEIRAFRKVYGLWGYL